MNYLQKNTKSNRLTKTFGLLLFAMSFVLFFSCDKDDDPDMDPDPVVLGKYEVGTFILNEGGFGNNNASISFIDEDGMMIEKIFETETGGIIGDVAQSITFNDDKAYIVVNNSQKIEVVNADDFTSVGRIEGFGSPRYIVPHGDKAFVSNIFENQIDIVDLTSNTITSSLNFECFAVESWDCGFDKMIKAGETIFVVNNDGKKILQLMQPQKRLLNKFN